MFEIVVTSDRVTIRTNPDRINVIRNDQTNQSEDNHQHETQIPETSASVKESFNNFKKLTETLKEKQEIFEGKYLKNDNEPKDARYELWQMILYTKQTLLACEKTLSKSLQARSVPTPVTTMNQENGINESTSKPTIHEHNVEKIIFRSDHLNESSNEMSMIVDPSIERAPEDNISLELETSPCVSIPNADEMETNHWSSQKSEMEAFSQENLFNMEIIRVERLTNITSTPFINDDETDSEPSSISNVDSSDNEDDVIKFNDHSEINQIPNIADRGENEPFQGHDVEKIVFCPDQQNENSEPENSQMSMIVDPLVIEGVYKDNIPELEASPRVSASNIDNEMETNDLLFQRNEEDQNMSNAEISTQMEMEKIANISSTLSTNEDDETFFTTNDETFFTTNGETSMFTNVGSVNFSDESSDGLIETNTYAPEVEPNSTIMSDLNVIGTVSTADSEVNVPAGESLTNIGNVNRPAISSILSSFEHDETDETNFQPEQKIRDDETTFADSGVDFPEVESSMNLNINEPAVITATTSSSDDEIFLCGQNKMDEEAMAEDLENDVILSVRGSGIDETTDSDLDILEAERSTTYPNLTMIPSSPEEKNQEITSDSEIDKTAESDTANIPEVESLRNYCNSGGPTITAIPSLPNNESDVTLSEQNKNKIVEAVVAENLENDGISSVRESGIDEMTDSDLAILEAERSTTYPNLTMIPSSPEEKNQEMTSDNEIDKTPESDTANIPEVESLTNYCNVGGPTITAIPSLSNNESDVTLSEQNEKRIVEAVVAKYLENDGLTSVRWSGIEETSDSNFDILEGERSTNFVNLNMILFSPEEKNQKITSDREIDKTAESDTVNIPEVESSMNLNIKEPAVITATTSSPDDECAIFLCSQNKMDEEAMAENLENDGITPAKSGISEMTDSDLDILEAERLMNLNVSSVNEPNNVRMVRSKRPRDSSSDDEIMSSCTIRLDRAKFGGQAPIRTDVDVSMDHDHNETASPNVKSNKRKKTRDDSSDDERMIEKARKTYDEKPIHRIRKKLLADDADDELEDVELVSIRKKRKCSSVSSDEYASGSSSDESHAHARKSIKKRRTTNLILDEAVVTSAKGRKNIREIMGDHELGEETRKTGKEEEARMKRVKERNVLLDQIEVQGTRKKLVLDCDPRTKKDLIAVHPKIVEKLKPHQVLGVRFMFNACYESVKRAAEERGGGCILAHCMGLGKTFQAIALIHAVLTSDKIKAKTVLVLCPLSTVSNWITEFDEWLTGIENKDIVKIYDIERYKGTAERAGYFSHWQIRGGVMILSYQMFRSLANVKCQTVTDKYEKQIRSALLNPGPDLVVCDEGHILKNENTDLSKATMSIRTRRRIVLSGTPMQNNLNEYYCMMQFIKPNLLGTKEQFQNRFVNPITNGQFKDSNPEDVALMKNRSYVLNRMVSGVVQRFGFEVIQPYLEPKYEYVIFVGLSDIQANLYKYYMDNQTSVTDSGKTAGLFANFSTLRLLWNHPLALKLNVEKPKPKEKKGNAEVENQWWRRLISETALQDASNGPKLILLLAILRHCEKVKDKLLVFSLSLPTLDMIEHFLQRREFGGWQKGKDYYRLDGGVPGAKRAQYLKAFNRADNPRGRLFLISTLAGGLGINMIGANRAVIFNACWNPSHDSQSVFRVYRLGQKKPCYIYRFISQGTMEEQIYKRQVTKLSVSGRVVDEHQIERHYYQRNIQELYYFERKFPTGENFKLPADHVMADLLKNHKDIILSYHEHDTLLKNKEDEELTDDSKLAAMQHYQVESAVPNVEKKVTSCSKESRPETCVAAASVSALDGEVEKRVAPCLKESIGEICVATTSVSASDDEVGKRVAPCSKESRLETCVTTASVSTLEHEVSLEKENDLTPDESTSIVEDHSYARSSDESNSEITVDIETIVHVADTEIVPLADMLTFGEFDVNRSATNESPLFHLGFAAINESSSLIDVKQQCRWW